MKQILKESISKQLVSDVEVGLQLSGGIDSSLITYFTDKITPKKYNLKTFSIIFDDLKYSEENWISLAIDLILCDCFAIAENREKSQSGPSETRETRS